VLSIEYFRFFSDLASYLYSRSTHTKLNVMKKICLIFITLFLTGIVLNSCSNDDEEYSEIDIPFENLPKVSKQFVSDHFADYDVSKTLESATKFTVLLSKKTVKASATSGTGYEIDFDLNGDWIKIEGHNNSVLPDNILALLPRNILSYVSQNYPTSGITEIEKKSYGYKIELDGKSDIEITFDTNGNYLGNDNDNEVITYDQLPTNAKEFLTTHFGTKVPSSVNKDGDSYDVKYSDKTEVEFELTGNWSEVEVGNTTMPQSIIDLLPSKIADYLTANYSSKKIESIKNKLSTYKLELNGDIELVFDKEGNLWGTGSNNSGNEQKNRIEFSELSTVIQSFLNQHFLTGTTTFLYAEYDDNEYEVKLANGTDIDFYANGELKSVEVLPGNNVPDGVMPASIVSYVKANYPDKKVEEFEKKTIGFKVELSGYPEIELIFDTEGNFKRVDN